MARTLWKDLARLAVGATHAARGNLTGAVTLLRRGADHIEPHCPLSASETEAETGILKRWDLPNR